MKIKVRKNKKKIGKAKSGRPKKKDIVAKFKLMERRRLALKLRQEGESYYRIGEACGTSTAIAWQDVDWMLTELNNKQAEEVEKLRRLELTRLDRLLEKLKLPLESKDYYERMAALDKALKIMDRRAKYIPGMDAPARVEGGVDDGVKNLIEQATGEVNLILKRLAGEEE